MRGLFPGSLKGCSTLITSTRLGAELGAAEEGEHIDLHLLYLGAWPSLLGSPCCKEPSSLGALREMETACFNSPKSASPRPEEVLTKV